MGAVLHILSISIGAELAINPTILTYVIRKPVDLPIDSFLAHLITGISRVVEEFVDGIFQVVVVSLPSAQSASALRFYISTYLDSSNNFPAIDPRDISHELLDLIL